MAYEDAYGTCMYNNWKFLSRYAHCCELRFKDVKVTQQFLAHCRNMPRKPCFLYLDFRRHGEGRIGKDSTQYLRGSKHLLFTYSSLVVEDNDEFFENIRGIQKLSTSCSTSPITTKHYENLRGIEKLCIQNGSISEENLRNLRGIKGLELYECTIDFEPSALINIRGIEKLYMESCEITEEHLYNIRGIKALTLYECNFDFPLSEFKNLRGIQNLDIWSEPLGGYGRLLSSDEFFQNVRGVKSLDISDPDLDLTDNHLVNLRGIRELRIEQPNAFRMTDDSFKNLRGIEFLELDNLEDCLEIGNAAFKEIQGVKHLSLVNFPGLTTEVLDYFVGIKILSMQQCDNVNPSPGDKRRHVRRMMR